MRTSDRMTLQNILLHKEYFDHKLIEIADHLEQNNSKLLDENERLIISNQTLRKKNAVASLKIKDLGNQKYGFDKKYLELKEEKDELVEYLKKIQKEMDELKKEINKQKKEISKQDKEINNQKSIIDKLRHLNSTNSNMPPSMDVLGHTKAKAQANTREKTNRKRGGQKNHHVHRSHLTQNADKVITIRVKKAPAGALPVKDKQGSVLYYVTQEVDLCLKSIIKETRYFIDDKGAELDSVTMSKFSVNPLIYSADFKAATVYLNQKGTIPLQRLSDILNEISKGSIQLRPSTISKWCQECHMKSTERREEILKDILSGALIHVDETGFKVNGEQYWIHVLTNEKGAYFLITKSRGDKEKGTIKYLENYTGYLMHDHFVTYQTLKLCKHVECNVHIDRYMKEGIDFDKDPDCKALMELMHEMLRRKGELIHEGRNEMPKEEIKEFEGKFIDILKRGQKKYTAKYKKVAKKYIPDYVSTFNRMLSDMDDYLMFIKDFIVPYTNNNAEKQCRTVKAKKKTSGQFVSEYGGQTYVSILSLLQTAKIRNENAFDVLRDVFH